MSDRTYMQAIIDSNWCEPIGAHGSQAVTTVATLTKPAGANKIMLQALTQNVRYTCDGSTATTTAGFQLKAADPPRTVTVGSKGVMVVAETGTASLQYQWGN